jgi:hypothetical protein
MASGSSGSGGSGNGGTSKSSAWGFDGMSAKSEKVIDDIKDTAYKAHLNSMDKASGEKSFENYLQNLVDNKKITNSDADKLYERYMLNKL